MSDKSKQDIEDAFKGNPGVIVGEDGSVYYCPDNPYKRDPNACPPEISAKHPPNQKETKPWEIKQKSPNTKDIQKLYSDDNVMVDSEGTIMYCRPSVGERK